MPAWFWSASWMNASAWRPLSLSTCATLATDCNTQFRLPDLLRQSIDSRLAGYEDLNDAARLSTDPTFRLIGSPTRWDRSAALTSTLRWFETELLTREENLVGL